MDERNYSKRSENCTGLRWLGHQRASSNRSAAVLCSLPPAARHWHNWHVPDSSAARPRVLVFFSFTGIWNKRSNRLKRRKLKIGVWNWSNPSHIIDKILNEMKSFEKRIRGAERLYCTSALCATPQTHAGQRALKR